VTNLRDVAKRSGVSVATVSHVLNNRNHNMSARTRQRVLDAIRELGYRPGTAPVASASRRAQAIGVFVWLSIWEPEPLCGNIYAVRVLDGIIARTLPHHWNVTLINVTTWEDARAQIRQFADGRCDGFILIAPPQGMEIAGALAERGYPFVLINAGAGDNRVSSVDINNVAACREVITHLIERGHHRIAFLLGEESYDNTGERVEGFRAAFKDAGLLVPEDLILHDGSYEIGSCSARLEQMLERAAGMPESERPTAVLCGNDVMASEARRFLTGRGIRVPEDISLVGFDDSAYAREMDPPLTTVYQPLQLLGTRAADKLLKQIEAMDAGTPAGVAKEFLPHRLIVRDSVADRTAGRTPARPTAVRKAPSGEAR